MFLSYDLVDRVAKVAAVNSNYGTVNAFFNVLTRDLPMTKLQRIFPWSIMRRSMRLFQSHALATHWQNDVALPAQLYQSLLAWTSLDPESLQTHKAFLSTFFNGDGFLLGGHGLSNPSGSYTVAIKDITPLQFSGCSRSLKTKLIVSRSTSQWIPRALSRGKLSDFNLDP